MQVSEVCVVFSGSGETDAGRNSGQDFVGKQEVEGGDFRWVNGGQEGNHSAWDLLALLGQHHAALSFVGITRTSNPVIRQLPL